MQQVGDRFHTTWVDLGGSREAVERAMTGPDLARLHADGWSLFTSFILHDAEVDRMRVLLVWAPPGPPAWASNGVSRALALALLLFGLGQVGVGVALVLHLVRAGG